MDALGPAPSGGTRRRRSRHNWLSLSEPSGRAALPSSPVMALDEPLTEKMRMVQLPEELWLAILSHLHEIRDVTAAALVCRQWYRLMQDPFLETERLGSLFLLGTTVLDFSRLMVVTHDHADEHVLREALGLSSPPPSHHHPTHSLMLHGSGGSRNGFVFANWDEYDRLVKQDGKYVACLAPSTGAHRHDHVPSAPGSSPLAPTASSEQDTTDANMMSVKMLHLESSKVLWEVAWPSSQDERLVCFFQDKLKVWIVKERSISWHLKRTGRLGASVTLRHLFDDDDDDDDEIGTEPARIRAGIVYGSYLVVALTSDSASGVKQCLLWLDKTTLRVKDRKDKTEGLPGQMILNVLRPPYVSQPLLACVINNELKVYDEHGHELHIFGFKTSFLLGKKHVLLYKKDSVKDKNSFYRIIRIEDSKLVGIFPHTLRNDQSVIVLERNESSKEHAGEFEGILCSSNLGLSYHVLEEPDGSLGSSTGGRRKSRRQSHTLSSSRSSAYYSFATLPEAAASFTQLIRSVSSVFPTSSSYPPPPPSASFRHTTMTLDRRLSRRSSDPPSHPPATTSMTATRGTSAEPRTTSDWTPSSFSVPTTKCLWTTKNLFHDSDLVSTAAVVYQERYIIVVRMFAFLGGNQIFDLQCLNKANGDIRWRETIQSLQESDHADLKLVLLGSKIYLYFVSRGTSYWLKIFEAWSGKCLFSFKEELGCTAG